MHYLFFFQAEDGIRDVAVTGVQTCALPISFSFSAGDFVKDQIWELCFMTVATTTEVEERHSREAIEAEIARVYERVHQLRRGEITEQQFPPFRLKHGTYGQRQPRLQMLRRKVA